MNTEFDLEKYSCESLLIYLEIFSVVSWNKQIYLTKSLREQGKPRAFLILQTQFVRKMKVVKVFKYHKRNLKIGTKIKTI